MTDIRVSQDSAARNALKEERARDAARALREYESEKKAIATKTERLKALRLAKEAAESASEPKPKKTAAKPKKAAAKPKKPAAKPKKAAAKKTTLRKAAK